MTFNLFVNATESFSWIPSPSSRGSSDILQSCLITIGLCVWTAVHLNIPENDRPSILWVSSQSWRKVYWLLIGLVAPEVLIYTAWMQRAEAKRFMDYYNLNIARTPVERNSSIAQRCLQGVQRLRRNIVGNLHLGPLQIPSSLTTNVCQSCFGYRNSPSEDEKASHQTLGDRSNSVTEPWTLTQGFYAQMGGFVLDTTGACPDVVPPDRSVLTFASFREVIDAANKNRKASTGSPDSNIVASSRIASSSNRPTNDNAEEPPHNHARESGSVSDNRIDSDRSRGTQGSYSISDSKGQLGNSILRCIMNVSEKDIKDKNKADRLAKTLVCVQAL